ncbi:MAG: fumarate hydratase C-terminal domain-containing protein [Thermoguttaceae bacterium]
MDLWEAFDKNFEPGWTAMRLLTREGVRAESRGVVRVAPEALGHLAREAFREVNFLLRSVTLEQWAAVLDDPAAGANDRYVAAALLKNAAIAAEGALPLCQDTGTAAIIARKGEAVRTGGDDAHALAAGVAAAYSGGRLRFSQLAPLSMCDERNTGTNLPAQIEIHAAPGDQFHFLFIAKGGGSSNKTVFFQKTKSLLSDEALAAFLRRELRALGVAACPPYHLALVVGGPSPEMNLKVLKLATAGALDCLPAAPDGSGAPYRDRTWEERLLQVAAASGLGAQFGGRWLAIEARVIRCARHGGSCPLSLGVSCSAHRNALGRIGPDGVFLEQLDRDPGRFLQKALAVLGQAAGGAARIDLDQPPGEIRRQLAGCPPGTLVLLSGTLILARDLAHARFHELLKAGRPLPDYLSRHVICYAGPAEAPPGAVIGSFGPTTAERMDDYLPELMARGASLITLAKGNRSAMVAAACRRFGGFYLGTIGGAAAWLARDHVLESEVIDYAEFGMEAVRRIKVRELPAFVVIDDKGSDLYSDVSSSDG